MRIGILGVLAAILLSACPGPDEAPWQVVYDAPPEAEGLISVWGTSTSDVWAVGGDAGDGPIVLHYDGTVWERLPTGTTGDLWWVFGFAGGPVYLGGAGGTILRYQDGAFTPMTTPRSDVAVFGIWGATPSEVWAVGGAIGGASGAFAWRLSGDAWVEAAELPGELAASEALWKCYGLAPNDVWFVGTRGLALHWDGTAFTEVPTDVGESLFTVHANGGRYVAVGGYGAGYVIEWDGTRWANVTPAGAPSLAGVCLTADAGFVSGQYGTIYRRDGAAWVEVETDLDVDTNVTLHALWIDPEGGIWAAGACIACPSLSNGILLHRGDEVSSGGLSSSIGTAP